LCFFFQAEDGIRDRNVTGVQTCALPILVIKAIGTPSFLQNVLHIPPIEAGWEIIVSPFAYAAFNLALAQAVLVPIATEVNDKDKIGRASCRERGEIEEGAEAVEDKNTEQ